MCAPIAGHSELVFFINQPNKQPRRKTLTESLITGSEKPFFDNQYGQCASINNSAAIRLDLQNRRLSLSRLRMKPLNNISSEIGEMNTPASMPSHSDDLAASIAPAFRPESSASPRTTRESQTRVTTAPIIKPFLFSGVVSFRYVNGRRRDTPNVMKTGTTQMMNLTAFE